MIASLVVYLFYADIFAHAVLIAGTVWCIAVPARRIYPMQTKGPWFYLMWALFWFVFVANGAIAVLDWNSGPWSSELRLFVAVPIFALGSAFVTWGIATLGTRNTSGVRDGFVARGPYLISRNPQYAGDILLFSGIAIAANSELVLITHLLTSLMFVLAPLAEEPWLEGEYGENYFAYRREVSRFL